MNPYSPISWLYVHGFLGQNSKNWILRLLLDIWKSGSVCECTVVLRTNGTSAVYRSKMAFFKRAWQKVKVLSRP